MNRLIAQLWLAVLLGLAQDLFAQATLFVDGSNTNDPAENGSEAHPYDRIQEGLNAAGYGDTVVVADGRYTGTGNRGLDINKPVTLKSLNGPQNCIIDCEGSGGGILIRYGPYDLSVFIQGFTLCHGNAEAALQLSRVDMSAVIENCIISDNAGTAIYSYDSNARVVNCLIERNDIAVVASFGLVELWNCTMRGQTNEFTAIFQNGYNGSARLYNCISWGQGPGLVLAGWGNGSFMASYSDVQYGSHQPGFDGTCIEVDPKFVSETDSHLTYFSPCLTRGTEAGAPTNDLAGIARGIPPDMGAFEYPKTDADSDTLPDWWEMRFFGTTTNGPSDDNDQDQLSNAAEREHGTSPVNPDTDVDSLVDGWEVRYGFSPTADGASPSNYVLNVLSTLHFTSSVTAVALDFPWLYAVVGTDFLSISITNPALPQVVAKVACVPVLSISRLQIANDMAFLAGDQGARMTLVDIRQPSTPFVAFATNEHFYYSSDLSAGSSRVVQASTFAIYPDSTLRISSWTNTGAVTLLGATNFYNNGVRMGSIESYDRYTYVGVESRLWTFDLVDETRPRLVYTNTVESGAYLGDMAMSSNQLFWANGAKLYRTDLTVPSVPLMAATSSLIASGVALDVIPSLVAVAESWEGVEFLDASTLATFGRYRIPGEARHLAMQDNLLAVANGTAGIMLINLSGADLDGDAMPDDWEAQYLDGISALPGDDRDVDGVSNLGEFRAGLNPLLKDTDGDGLDDYVEIATLFSNPSRPDTDGDGQTDGEEFRAGTDLLDANSYFGMAAGDIFGGYPVISWRTVYGKHYRVERAEDVVLNRWTNLWSWPIYELDEYPEGSESLLDLYPPSNAPAIYRVLTE